MAHGVALHQALERYFRETQNSSVNSPLDKGEAEGVLVNFNLLQEEFIHALRGQNIPKEKFEEIQDHGLEILKTYYEQKIQSVKQNTNMLLEFNFGKHHPQIDGIPITGKADRIDFLDEEKKKARIIDYKSGAPKKIKIGESHWRQLVFYDLMARHSHGLGWESSEGVIEFLKPNKKGLIQSESHVVTDEERATVIQELKSADQAIKNLEFPIIKNPKDDKDIEYWNNFGR